MLLLDENISYSLCEFCHFTVFRPALFFLLVGGTFQPDFRAGWLQLCGHLEKAQDSSDNAPSRSKRAGNILRGFLNDRRNHRHIARAPRPRPRRRRQHLFSDHGSRRRFGRLRIRLAPSAAGPLTAINSARRARDVERRAIGILGPATGPTELKFSSAKTGDLHAFGKPGAGWFSGANSSCGAHRSWPAGRRLLCAFFEQWEPCGAEGAGGVEVACWKVVTPAHYFPRRTGGGSSWATESIGQKRSPAPADRGRYVGISGAFTRRELRA